MSALERLRSLRAARSQQAAFFGNMLGEGLTELTKPGSVSFVAPPPEGSSINHTKALADLATRWRSENPLPANDAAACAHCGTRGPDTPVLARGGHAWLHKACWGPMDAARQREALGTVQALLGSAP
jgi:hypothetical protein